MRVTLALCALFTCSFLPLNATSLGDLTYTKTDGEVAISSVKKSAIGELVIPDTIEQNPVTRIGNSAFYCCTSLTKITIPDGVTSIGNFALSYCDSLTNITVPYNVTRIGVRAFVNCTSLAWIKFEGTAPAVGADAFIGLPEGAVTVVTSEHLGSYQWNGFTATTADQYGKLSKLEA